MAERDFDKERKKKPGHTFKLGGETFHTYPGLSVTLLKHFQTRKEGEELSGQEALDETLDFIRTLIVKGDREKFNTLIDSEDIYIDGDDLLELSNWLVEVISGRPTKRPASSGNGAAKTGTGSKAKPSARATKTGKDSPPVKSSS